MYKTWYGYDPYNHEEVVEKALTVCPYCKGLKTKIILIVPIPEAGKLLVISLCEYCEIILDRSY